MSPLEERIELLLDSFGLEKLLEELDIEPTLVVELLIDMGYIKTEELYEL